MDRLDHRGKEYFLEMFPEIDSTFIPLYVIASADIVNTKRGDPATSFFIEEKATSDTKYGWNFPLTPLVLVPRCRQMSSYQCVYTEFGLMFRGEIKSKVAGTGGVNPDPSLEKKIRMP